MAGNTGYVTENFIKKAFPQCYILLLGNPRIKSDKKKRIVSLPFPEEEEELREIFEAYEFDRVVYFSEYLTFHNQKLGEMERLKTLLNYCSEEGINQMIYLASACACGSDVTGEAVLVRAAEDLCRYYAGHMQMKVIRLPYLYSGVMEQDYFYRLFRKLQEEKRVVFPESAEQRVSFLCMNDLAKLLYRMCDSWDEVSETLQVPDSFGLTFQELADEIGKLKPEAEFVFIGQGEQEKLPKDDKVLRRRYYWFPRISVLEELSEMYEQYQQLQEGRISRWERLEEWVRRKGKLLRLVEFGVSFLVIELLNRLTGGMVQFEMVDLRLLFVVLMGIMYGMNMGIAAALLESVALVIAYSQQGISWLTLFYEPTNWIPFIAYFVVGAICGYVRLRNQDMIRFAKKENELIQEKFFFMRRLYRDTLREKKEYKKQIIGSQDSFGKIFNITRQLDVVLPQEILIKTIQVMEEVLENQTISIYSIGKNKSFARLEAASRGISQDVPRSIRMEEYTHILGTLAEDEVWSNTELKEGYPMYMAGIRRGGGLVLLILVHEVEYSQMTLYYSNLLKILCGLIGASLLRALDYQEAIRRDQYLENTNIMKESYFMDVLNLQHSMLEQKIADFTLLRLERGDMTLEEADEILRTKIRENDILGVSS